MMHTHLRIVCLVALVLCVEDSGPASAGSTDQRLGQTSQELEQLRKELQATKKQLADQERLIGELKESNRLREQLAASVKKIAELEKTIQEFRNRAVQSEIEAAALRERNEALVGQLQDLSKDLKRRLEEKGVKPKPPAKEVRGTVTKVDQTGLLVLSVGQDAGLARGNTLEVFRLQPDARYLGQVQIIEVRDKEAVAKKLGDRPKEPIRVGDQVTSRIAP
jgi:chromosome segregation ATPase